MSFCNDVSVKSSPLENNMEQLVRECLLRNSRFKNVSKDQLIIQIVKLEEEVVAHRINSKYFQEKMVYLEKVKSEMISAIEDSRSIKIKHHDYDKHHVSVLIENSH